MKTSRKNAALAPLLPSWQTTTITKYALYRSRRFTTAFSGETARGISSDTHTTTPLHNTPTTKKALSNREQPGIRNG